MRIFAVCRKVCLVAALVLQTGCITVSAASKPRLVSENLSGENTRSYSGVESLGLGAEIFSPFPVGLRINTDVEAYKVDSAEGTMVFHSRKEYLEGFVGLSFSRPSKSMALTQDYFYLSGSAEIPEYRSEGTGSTKDDAADFRIEKTASDGSSEYTLYKIKTYRRVAIGYALSTGSFERRGSAMFGFLTHVAVELGFGAQTLYQVSDTSHLQPYQRKYYELGLVGAIGGGFTIPFFGL